MRCDQQRAARHWLVSKATRGNGREQPIAVSQRASNESRPGQDVPPCHLSCATFCEQGGTSQSLLEARFCFFNEKKKNHWDHRLYLSQPLIVRKVLTAGIINNYASDADIILTELQRHINSTQNWQQGPSPWHSNINTLSHFSCVFFKSNMFHVWLAPIQIQRAQPPNRLLHLQVRLAQG